MSRVHDRHVEQREYRHPHPPTPIYIANPQLQLHKLKRKTRLARITMEFSVCHKSTHKFCSSLPTHKTKGPSSTTLYSQTGVVQNLAVRSWSPTWGSLRQRAWQNQWSRVMQQQGVAVRCADLGCSSSGAVGSEIERELEAEMEQEGEEEWMTDKCGGGAVELLECLEREAIMGDDEGKEPNDYNRRAQIFYKSSRVFQALKERTNK